MVPVQHEVAAGAHEVEDESARRTVDRPDVDVPLAAVAQVEEDLDRDLDAEKLRRLGIADGEVDQDTDGDRVVLEVEVDDAEDADRDRVGLRIGLVLDDADLYEDQDARAGQLENEHSVEVRQER